MAEPAPPPREPTFAERQLAGAEQRAAACAYETKHLWLCSDAGGRLAARPFFALLGDPAWRLESHDAASGLSTWRLSKEGAKVSPVNGRREGRWRARRPLPLTRPGSLAARSTP